MKHCMRFLAFLALLVVFPVILSANTLDLQGQNLQSVQINIPISGITSAMSDDFGVTSTNQVNQVVNQQAATNVVTTTAENTVTDSAAKVKTSRAAQISIAADNTCSVAIANSIKSAISVCEQFDVINDQVSSQSARHDLQANSHVVKYATTVVESICGQLDRFTIQSAKIGELQSSGKSLAPEKNFVRNNGMIASSARDWKTNVKTDSQQFLMNPLMAKSILKSNSFSGESGSLKCPVCVEEITNNGTLALTPNGPVRCNLRI